MAAFNPNKTPIDFFLLGGQKSPGTTKIVKASSPRAWDQRQGYGLSGSFPVFTGLKLSEFDALVTLAEDEDYEAWATFKPPIQKPPYGKRPKAFDLWHPWLEELEIRSGVCVDLLQPIDNEDGSHTYTIQLLTFRKPKIVLAKPTAADKPKSEDPWDKEIERLTTQVQALNG